MFHIKSLPIDLQKVAETELDEVPQRIESDLEALRTWIEQEPHLKARLDPQFLIQYLRGCKYSLERSKEKIDSFFTLKSKFPELFNVTDLDDSRFRYVYKYGYCAPLPRPLNDHGPRIFFLNFAGDIGKGLIDIEDMFRVMNAMHEIIIMDDPYAGINGIVYVLDLKEMSINMAAKYTPSFLRKTVQFYEKSLPLRIKAAHMVNTPPVFYGVLNLLMPLLSEKLRKRIFVYGQNHDNLKKLVPRKYLPQQLGGENGNMEQVLRDFDRKWLEYADYFGENKHYGTIEHLRPGKPIDFDGMYGMGGSFRKLDVD